MIDKLPAIGDAQPLNSYNVAQLQFALEDTKTPTGIDNLAFDVHILDHLSGSASPAIVPTSDAEIDYSARRMSSSAASDSSSLQSRPEKRAPSPTDSPLPKRPRPGVSLESNPWADTPSPQPNADQEDRSTADLSNSSPRVQLPSLASTFQDRHELRRASLPTLYSESSVNRPRLPLPAHRAAHSSSGLVSYQFPPPDSSDDKFAARPRLATDTQLGLYGPDYSLPNTALSSSSSFSFPSASPLSASTDYKTTPSGLSLSDADHWASGIVRPSSTPSQPLGTLSQHGGLKYDDSLRHSISGPVSHQLFGGVTRISGQHHHLNASSDRSNASVRNGLASGIKTEGDWTFPSPDFNMSTSSGAYPSSTTSMGSSASGPSISVTSSPTRSPQAQAPAPSSLVERPPRKRGKLPKPVTDFLKDWLHRHSDHPYPSEEEKKQLCHATGLSMSQVSNWMINARRRILAPAHRAAAGPTTTTPFSSRSGPSVLDTGRRASMPADSLQLYYPMSLQSLPEHAHLSSTRHMVGMTRSLSSSHATVGSLSATAGHSHHGHSPYSLDSTYPQGRVSYGGSGSPGLHSHSHSGSGYLGVPMSAPSSIPNPNPFLGSQPHQQQSMYGHTTQTQNPYLHSSQNGNGRHEDSHGPQARYTFPDSHGQSVSPQPGSGYGTPQ